MTECKCKVCKYHKNYIGALSELEEYSYSRHFFTEMYERLELAETDLYFYKMKYKEMKEEQKYFIEKAKENIETEFNPVLYNHKVNKIKESMRYYG